MEATSWPSFHVHLIGQDLRNLAECAKRHAAYCLPGSGLLTSCRWDEEQSTLSKQIKHVSHTISAWHTVSVYLWQQPWMLMLLLWATLPKTLGKFHNGCKIQAQMSFSDHRPWKSPTPRRKLCSLTCFLGLCSVRAGYPKVMSCLAVDRSCRRQKRGGSGGQICTRVCKF